MWFEYFPVEKTYLELRSFKKKKVFQRKWLTTPEQKVKRAYIKYGIKQ